MRPGVIGFDCLVDLFRLIIRYSLKAPHRPVLAVIRIGLFHVILGRFMFFQLLFQLIESSGISCIDGGIILCCFGFFPIIFRLFADFHRLVDFSDSAGAIGSVGFVAVMVGEHGLSQRDSV